MKNREARLAIKRTSTSPYFSEEFNLTEKLSLEAFADMLESTSSEAPDILITNTHTNFDTLTEADLDKIKLIIHPNSGYDNIPADFVKGSKAPIIIGSTIRAQAVTQYILSALLNHFSPITHQSSWDKTRKWPRRLLSELKVCLVGHGHIGKLLSASLTPLVGELKIYDPFENMPTLDHKSSDVVILACGLNPKSRHLIEKNFLNHVSEKALIINAARGELIKTSDLVNFLMANEEAFAVLDVFEKEPNDFSAFKDLKNIKLTSHIAGVYKNIDEQTIKFETQVVQDFIGLTEFDFKNKYQKMILQNRLKAGIGLI